MPNYLSPGVFVEEIPSLIQPIVGAGTTTCGFIGVFGDTIKIPRENPDYDSSKKQTVSEAGSDSAENPDPGTPPKRRGQQSSAGSNSPYLSEDFKPVPEGDVRLVTNQREFMKLFGELSEDEGHSIFIHAVCGFFINGGTRAYVVRVKDYLKVRPVALTAFESIDEIAMIAAPGITDDAVTTAVIDHCEKHKCFAIVDCARESETDGIFDANKLALPRNSNCAAVYTPWFMVPDRALHVLNPDSRARRLIPPSGHMAGIYARTDSTFGVHKAPANTVIRGIRSDWLRYQLSSAQQDGLNPKGINCIRNIRGNPTPWGARTLGGDDNMEFKYIPVRRLFLYLRKSIENGMLDNVFEPNSPRLWGKIIFNASAFLTNVWRDGALFGNTPQEAFYVKCDAETNPPEVREIGQVVTEIGLAVAKPAEFVVFKVSQWQPGAGMNE